MHYLALTSLLAIPVVLAVPAPAPTANTGGFKGGKQGFKCEAGMSNWGPVSRASYMSAHATMGAEWKKEFSSCMGVAPVGAGQNMNGPMGSKTAAAGGNVPTSTAVALKKGAGPGSSLSGGGAQPTGVPAVGGPTDEEDDEIVTIAVTSTHAATATGTGLVDAPAATGAPKDSPNDD
ncbi:hypothetical protein EJ08DRAFT_731776 [Tothia fuscella]|uniref:Uncharacterized protein n=1 Tax=Tothia fuscella TaxID=1048955 RepID=A0A9P4NW71_9PEZI|nr:hypothetical protein EJ08DRAFT_731776 [Tothia fuscella]